MTMRSKRTALALLTLATASPAFAASLITNGSFETGAAPGSFTTESAGSTDITGWTIASGSVDYIGSYWAASDGARSIDIAGSAIGALSQSFATTAGQKYLVTFDLSSNRTFGARATCSSRLTAARLRRSRTPAQRAKTQQA